MEKEKQCWGASKKDVVERGVEKDRASGAKRVDGDKVCLGGAKPGKVIGARAVRSWRPT